MNYIFFDLDGTLHQQDMLEDYLRFMVKNRFLWSILVSPFLFLSYVIYLCFSKKTWGLNPLFFVTHFGLSLQHKNKLAKEFKQLFLSEVMNISKMHQQMKQHIQAGDRIIIISGSLYELIDLIYPTLNQHQNIDVIASQTKKFLGSTILQSRCSGKNKVKLLDQKYASHQIKFEMGYSDDLSDRPILKRCKWAYLVDKHGNLTLIN